jgi:hypothetical protein
VPNGAPHSGLENLVYQHDQDLYRGNGRPGLTTRVWNVENDIEQIKVREEKRTKKWDRIEILVWAAVIAAIANLISSHLK